MDTQSNKLVPPPPEGQIEVGTVGHDDREDHAVVGEVGTESEGYTLVRVQLFRDRDITKPQTPGIGQGHKLLCHLSSSIGRIPPKHTRVLVAIPNRMAQSHSSTVIAVIEKNRIEQLETGRAVLDYTGQKLLIRADDIVLQSTTGNCTLMTTVDGTPTGKPVALQVSSTAVKATAPWGHWDLDLSGWHCVTKFGPRFDMGGVSIPGIPDSISGMLTGYAKITAPIIKASGLVYLGAGPSFNPCIQAPAGYAPGTVGTPITVLNGTHQSASVWITAP